MLFGATDVRLEALDARLSPADRHDYEQVRADILDTLGNSEWDGAWQQGRVMTTEQVVAYALEVRDVRTRT